MRRVYDYLLTSQLLRRARFLLPLLFLVALISFSVTISSVQSTAEANRDTEKGSPRWQPVASATPTTAEICAESQKIIDEYQREYDELLRTRMFKMKENTFRNKLSTLDKTIATGSFLSMGELRLILQDVKVELPKSPITGSEKELGQLTAPERSSLQRTLRSVIHRGLEQAANTTMDRLNDRISKNLFQTGTRRQRMKDLDCVNVLKRKKGETVDSDKTPDISGTWKYGGYVYNIKQSGSTFTWYMETLKENATGTIKGKSVSANVVNINRTKDITGTVTEVDGSGRATRIEFSNGTFLTR
jgi:hypothetical protein